jgi:hypothetical protein
MNCAVLRSWCILTLHMNSKRSGNDARFIDVGVLSKFPIENIGIHIREREYEPEIIFVDKKPRNNIKALFGTERLSEVYDF